VGKRWTSIYLKLATVKPRSACSDEPWLILTTAHPTYSPETASDVIQQPFENCRTKVYSVAVVGIERDATRTIASNRTTVTSNGACGAWTLATACAVNAGIEAVQMIRKGQVIGITKKNLHGQAWIFGNLLGLN
jgi:hypothetical protein